MIPCLLRADVEVRAVLERPKIDTELLAGLRIAFVE